MFLELSHTKLNVFKVSKEFVLSCYKEALSLPSDERFSMIQQIRRAALSFHLNVAEGCSGKSVAERGRFYENPRGSLIEADAAFEIVSNLNYIKKKLSQPGLLTVRTFQLISKMIS